MRAINLLFLFLNFIAIFCGNIATSWADSLRVLAADLAPYAYMDNHQVAGVSVDLTAEMAKRLGYQVSFEVMPFPRATNEINLHPDVLMLQVARIEERDDRFIWLADLFDEPFYLFVRADSSIDPDFFFHNKPAPGPIGVLRSGISQKVALDYNLAPLEPVSDEQTDARKIVNGRIQAWLGSYNTVHTAMRQAGYAPELLRAGRIIKRFHLYLVAGTASTMQEPKRWAEVLQTMKQDGSYQRILERYHYCQRPSDGASTQYGMCP